MAPITLPSQEYLRQCFDYDPETGILRWRERPNCHFRGDALGAAWNTKYAAKRAGNLSRPGYWRVRLDNHEYRASRVIWKLVANEEPETVDHINHVTTDDRFANLRAATRSENQWNRRGCAGAYRHGERWLSKIQYRGRIIQLGVFRTRYEAQDAYRSKARELFGDYWGGP